MVKCGKDITDVDSFLKHVTPTNKVKLIQVHSNDIQNMQAKIPERLEAVAGISQIHQVTWQDDP